MQKEKKKKKETVNKNNKDTIKKHTEHAHRPLQKLTQRCRVTVVNANMQCKATLSEPFLHELHVRLHTQYLHVPLSPCLPKPASERRENGICACRQHGGGIDDKREMKGKRRSWKESKWTPRTPSKVLAPPGHSRPLRRCRSGMRIRKFDVAVRSPSPMLAFACRCRTRGTEKPSIMGNQLSLSESTTAFGGFWRVLCWFPATHRRTYPPNEMLKEALGVFCCNIRTKRGKTGRAFMGLVSFLASSKLLALLPCTFPLLFLRL